MKKKLLASALAAAAAAAAITCPGASAAEAWRDPFVTRLMKIIAQDPSYTDVVLTDLDRNGIPEAFVLRKGTYGNIGSGFTMVNNALTDITVPKNIIGECLENISVYIKNDKYIFVGQEVSRYRSHISYYKLELDGTTLRATRIVKNDVSPYSYVTYVDKFSSDLLENGYPNRTKIADFIASYDMVNNLSATHSTAAIRVNGEDYTLGGFNINDNNYFKLRDIAMLLRSTSKKFNVDWDTETGGIVIRPGEDYVAIGGELMPETEADFTVSESETPIFVNDRQRAITAYNINGSAYFRIRDIGEAVGFEIGWDADTQTITLDTE